MTPPTTTPFARHPNGRINWQAEKTHRALARLLRQGQSVRDIAARYHVSSASLMSGLIYHGLNLPPKGEVLLCEVAQSFGVTLEGMHAIVKRAGVPLRYWGGRRVLLECEVNGLHQMRGVVIPVVDTPPDGYASTQQLAAWWQCSSATARKRLSAAGVGASYTHRTPADRFIPLYDVRQASTAAPAPAMPRTRPAGHLSVLEVAELTGTSSAGVNLWASQGAPHCQIFHHQTRMFHPERLAAWLESRPQERTRRKARPLRRLIAQQRAA